MTRQQVANKSGSISSSGRAGQPDALSCLPSSFVSRGVRTPFTTKSLRYARVLIGQSGRTLVSLPGLSGGLGTYEMPLETLREVFDLSVHDRMLFDRLITLEKFTPELVREHARAVAVTGVGGVALAHAGIIGDKEEKAARELGQLTLLYQALRQLGGDDVQDMKREDLLTMEGQVRARKALNRFATVAGVANDSIIDSLGEWSVLSAPVGLAIEGCEGPLRLLTFGLQKLAGDVEEWSISEQSDFRFMATRVINAASATNDHAMRLLRKIDLWNNELGKVLKDWSTAKNDLHKQIERLWWVLDGWQELIDLWRSRPQHDRVRQREIVEEIASFAPVLPIEELEKLEYEFWVDVRVNQMLWASELRKLGSGEIDADMVDRLERFRRQSA
ncbi:hypothetical protein [Thalassospira australica]|uniref:hypothetical protein n=1 Tax=Thalassospira australica TaxID=1528106 RepID=UPI00384BB39E